MAKFTNYTPGPKGVRTVNGLVFIAPGQTSEDLDVSEGELKAAKATGWFSRPKVEDEDDDETGLSAMTVVELKALAEAEEIDLGDATKKADIVAAIELAREAKAEA